MRNFQDKKRWRGALLSKPVLVLLGIMVLIFAWSVIGLLDKMGETIKNKKIAEEKVAELQKNKEKLSLDISKLETDEGKEDSIREKFGWVKEGEGIIVVMDDKTSQQANTATQPSGFFSWLKNLFK